LSSNSLCHILCVLVKAEDIENVSKSLALFYGSYSSKDLKPLTKFIQWSFQMEVERNVCGDTLLREDSLQMRIILEFMQIFGRNYLRETLASGVQKILHLKSEEKSSVVKIKSNSNRKIILKLTKWARIRT